MPSTIEDYQAILNNDVVMNNWLPAFGMIGSDNFYVEYPAWQATSTTQERNAYIWAKDIYNGEKGFDWQMAYQAIGYTNVVLEGIQKIKPTSSNQASLNTLRGSALFFRSFAFYELAQLFAPPYEAATAAKDLGIPLKTSSDVNELFPRASVEETYQRIHQDLDEAMGLLPQSSRYLTQPSRLAAQALLARVWLTQGNYTKALEASDALLKAYGTLIDYNGFNTTSTISFPAYPNTVGEVVFYAVCNSFGIASYSGLKADTTLYKSYATNDLRKDLFFKNNGTTGIAYKGDYNGNVIPSKFSGFATNEMYLIRAECKARLGSVTEAMTDLNTLLVKRWKTGTFTPLTAASQSDAITKILAERRKEIPFSCGLRWEDLRRLNKEPAFAKTLTRTLNGTTYTLPPNDPRYVYPIPDAELKLNNISQNPR
jgi:tetratricopeptide (TPR) repeat protein